MPLTFQTFLSSPLKIFLEDFLGGPWEGTVTGGRRSSSWSCSAQPRGLLSTGSPHLVILGKKTGSACCLEMQESHKLGLPRRPGLNLRGRTPLERSFKMSSFIGFHEDRVSRITRKRLPRSHDTGKSKGRFEDYSIRAHRGASKWTVRKTAFSSSQRSGHSLGFTRLGTSLYRMIFVQIQLSVT